ncbi:MAG: alpha/beta hydrolase [Planctomycetes bacterium]|nr:alpha/beta hydrolase [Planctomycetota bacterium]
MRTNRRLKLLFVGMFSVYGLLFVCACSNQLDTQIAQSTEMLNRNIKEFVPDKIVTYKQIDGIELQLHIFFPPSHNPSQKTPTIVSFFGGGWNGGTIKHFYRQSEYWASRGMVAICADYRVASRHKAAPSECLQDAKSAIRWLRANYKELGIDPKRIASAGGSAGGHLAAATATTKKFNDPNDDLNISCKPNALILFNPVFDNGPDGFGYDRVKKYWKDFSPMHNLDKNTPPTIVFLGTKDKLIPTATAKKYKEKMESNGSRCELFLYDGQEHGFFNHGKNNTSLFFLQTLLESDRFLTSLGYLKGQPLIKDQYLN